MNIERINVASISGIYKKNQNESIQTKNNKTVPKDDVTLSECGNVFSTALYTAKNAADIRETKVSQISNQIRNGEYKIKSDDIANKIITNSYFVK